MRRDARLGAGAALDQLFKEGAVVNGPFFVFRYSLNTDEKTRWAFAVGKRAAPHAVTRNAVRRRMRAAARAAAVSLPIDIVLVAKAPGLTASVTELQGAIERAVRRVSAGERR